MPDISEKKSRFALGVLIVALVAGWAFGCIDDGPLGSTDPVTREAPLGDGGASLGEEEDARPEYCPEGTPKLGDSCPKSIEAEGRCTYKLEDCEYGGATYDVTVDYCCFEGQWSMCGTNETICDLVGDAGEVSGDGPGDASASDRTEGDRSPAPADAEVDAKVAVDVADATLSPDAAAPVDAGVDAPWSPAPDAGAI
jgi:hypothetical protein